MRAIKLLFALFLLLSCAGAQINISTGTKGQLPPARIDATGGADGQCLVLVTGILQYGSCGGAFSGTVDVAHGGTGLTTLPAHLIPVGNGTVSPNFVAAGTAGQVLISNGPGADPAMADPVVSQSNPALLNATVVQGTGTNLHVVVDAAPVTAVTGTFFQATQPVSGTFFQATQPISAVSLPLPAGAATAAKQAAPGVAGTPSTDVTTVQGVTGMTALKVDGSAVTQPVSGTFFQTTQPISAASLPLPAGAATAAKQPALGVAGTASTDVITVQGIAGATALKVDGSGVTQPVSGTFFQATQPVSGTITANAGTGTFAVSAASLPLPAGASTAAKQPALGTAGTAATDVISVQGITGMTALKVDGSGVTQPVSGTFFQTTQPVSAASLPLPTGAATAAKQPALGTAGTASADVITVQGVASMTALKVDGSGVTQPVSGTVTTTPPANASTNIAQINGVTPLMGNGTTGTGSPRVTIASDNTAFTVNAAQATAANLNATIVGTLANNGTAAGTNRIATLDGIAQTDYAGGTAYTAGRNAAPDIGTDGLLHVAALPAIRPASYSASATVSSAASATDIAVLPGNATNTVLVTKVIITCTQTTAGIITLNLIKRSSADSAGTSASMTVVPDDSNYAAGSSAPLTYTANPTTGGTVGNVDTWKGGCMATGTAGPNDIYIFNRQQKPIVLRGTAQQLAVNLGGVTVTGGSFAITFQYIETATITP